MSTNLQGLIAAYERTRATTTLYRIARDYPGEATTRFLNAARHMGGNPRKLGSRAACAAEYADAKAALRASYPAPSA